MKRTEEDIVFAAAFARELIIHYGRVSGPRAGRRRMRDEEFAGTLGVSRSALKKYLKGRAMPGVRTLVLAYERYGINLPYLGTPLFKGSRTRRPHQITGQLLLPFSIRSLNIGAVHAKVEATGPNRFEVRVNIIEGSA